MIAADDGARDVAPELVVAGHVTRDLVAGGWQLGGTATFAAWQAHRLGSRVGIVTRTDDETRARLESELTFAQIVVAPSQQATTFENVYEDGRRTQHLRARGVPIEPDDVPVAWRSAPIALLGAVFHEIAPGVGEVFEAASLVGGSAQGWLRQVDAEERVHPATWSGAPFWRGWDALFVSDEDLGEDAKAGRSLLEAWTRDVPYVAMTESRKGARVWADGGWWEIDAFPEEEVDPTGAGDTFATGFLIRLHESGDVGEAARFGAAAASVSVGGVGVAAMPDRAEVEARLAAYPGIVLRRGQG